MVDRSVATGAAPSKNAFVEQALVWAVDDVRRRQRRLGLEAASRDPLFLRDIEDVARDFQSVDAETARQIR